MAINPPIKTKVTIDPDTGAKVFNQSWSSEIKKKEPIVRKPVSRDTFVTEKKSIAKPAAKPVAKESIEKTSGVRKFSEVVIPKPAKAVGMEPKAGVDVSKRAKTDTRIINKMMIEAKRQTANAILKEKEEDLLKKNPGKNLNQIYSKQYRDEKRSYRQGERQLHRENQRIDKRDSFNGGGSEKQRSGGRPRSSGCGCG